MDDVDRDAGHFGQRDRAAGRFSLRARRTRERVVLRRLLSLAQRLLDEQVDDAAVLGVHADEAAVLPRAPQRAEDGRVVHHEDAGVGHEQLEAGEALVFDHRVHVAELRVLQLGDDHVERIVGDRFSGGLFHPRVERMAHRAAAILDREVDQARRPAERGGDRAGLEVVGRRGAAERHVEMRMNVDAARQDVLSRGVDRTVGLEAMRRQVAADGGDCAVLAVDVGDVVVTRRDDAAVGD